MATTYISKIQAINDPTYTEYIIKDAEARAQLDAISATVGNLNHTLQIGPYAFNGTQDVIIPIYDGSIS